MSVDTTNRKDQFTLNKTTATFDFTFRAIPTKPEDIKCLVTTNATDTALTYTTNYTVAVDSSGIGGVVTLVSVASIGLGTLTVYRETTNKQESDYEDYSQFPADTLETDLDIRTMVSQETVETIARCVKVPVSSTITSLETPSPDAGKALIWNATATGLTNSTININDFQSSVTTVQSSATVAINAATLSASSATVSLDAATLSASSATVAASLSSLYLTDSNTIISNQVFN